MASIVGEKPYRSADGWTITDKIFGYLDRAGNVYNKIRYPQPGDAGYSAELERQRLLNAGIFGLPRPMGAILLVGLIGGVTYLIYRIAK